MTYLVELDVFDAVEDKTGVVWVEFGRHRGIRPALRMDWGLKRKEKKMAWPLYETLHSIWSRMLCRFVDDSAVTGPSEAWGCWPYTSIHPNLRL